MSLSGSYRCCVLVPVYDNGNTIVSVLERILKHSQDVIVVCDGCTDSTEANIRAAALPVEIISYPENKGKGRALCIGFERALERGFDYALTIDADGQHFPEDIPAMLEAVAANPGAMIVGSRRLDAENMPSGNTFANRFSNFQFTVNTWKVLPDTQTGFRAYPLRKLPPLKLIPSRYEAELAILVLCAWGGVRLVSVPVRVHYPPKGERVSHFRPIADFMRIFALNTCLLLLAVFYGWPRMALNKLLLR